MGLVQEKHSSGYAITIDTLIELSRQLAWKMANELTKNISTMQDSNVAFLENDDLAFETLKSLHYLSYNTELTARAASY